MNLIKEKRNGIIKGRNFANGSNQKIYLKELESVASTTVFLEGLFTTLVIDAYKGREVATFDVPGAYLHANTPKDKKVLLKLRGTFMDIMCQINQDQKKNMRYENGQKVLDILVLRTIYGCIESALQWYKLYSETLTEKCFELNPYDRCVENKVDNGKQCTLLWYVDEKKCHVWKRK